MKSLRIQNLILIEKAEIAFGPGLNILTGETGSGKSAILTAIRLISGERADAQWIRSGADFAVVEAILEGPLFIRREIHRSGKNRCFIDDQLVSAAILRQAIDIEMIDQSSSQTLYSERRQMLDAFAGLKAEAKAYEASFAEEKVMESELEQLLRTPRERELEWAQKDLREIEAVDWKRGEEEKLAEEHHLLTHGQELLATLSSIAFSLTEGNELPSLKRVLTSLDQACRFDATLAPLAQSMKSALLELEEVGKLTERYAGQLDVDPARLAVVETRIGAIESLKRRFGVEIEQQKEKLKASIDRLTHLEERIASLQSSLEELQQKNRAWAQRITAQRKKASAPFAEQVLRELKSLNIPSAQFEIGVGENFGDISFLFSANPGTKPIPVNECASGGELSRLLLAIKTILAERRSCLVFDEIDSNVGGQTAAMLGEKLQRLAETRQILCVTHFVQVAKWATDHFLVSKKERGTSAYTTIEKLDAKGRDKEYKRMLGTEL